MNEPTILDPDASAEFRRERRRIPRATNRGPSLGRATGALLDGQVLHYPDESNHFNASNLRRTHRVILHTSLDGEGGRYWWVDPADDSSD